MMAKKKTVSIGIPAYNEENNIGALLESILLQKTESFKLEEVVVVSDGSTDQTVEIVKSYQKKYPFIKLLNDGKRIGQAGRLNELYKRLKSDIFITFDGDVILGSVDTILEIVSSFRDKSVGLVGGKKIPYEQKTPVGKAVKIYEDFWTKVIDGLKNGNNVHNHQGPISAASRKFLQSVVIPESTVASDHFLYFEALRLGFGFKYAKKAFVHFKVPSNLNDFIKQTTRFHSSAKIIQEHFGSWTENHYRIPLYIKLKAYVETFIRSPFYLITALVLQLIQRIYSVVRFEKKSTETWSIVASSK